PRGRLDGTVRGPLYGSMGELEGAQRIHARGDGRKRAVADVSLPADGRRRVAITSVAPSLAGGRVPVKRCEGDLLTVRADLVCDGHDRIAGVVRSRRPNEEGWVEHALISEGNDAYRAELRLDTVGGWEL